MVMSFIWTAFIGISILAALLLGNGAAVAAAVPQGAQAGIALAISMAGSICLWTGVGKLMEHAGMTDFIARMIRPLLKRPFATPYCPAVSVPISAPIF